MLDLGVNIPKQTNTNDTQRILLEKQDRADFKDSLLTRIHKKHEALVTFNYLLSFLGLGLSSYSIFVSLGLGVQSIFPFLIISLVLFLSALAYAYYYLSRLIFYVGLATMVCAFVIAFSML